MIVTVAVLELDSRFALIDKINFPSFSPFCVLGMHHCLLLVTVHEELQVISIVNDSPLALMLSNFDSDIFNVENLNHRILLISITMEGGKLILFS